MKKFSFFAIIFILIAGIVLNVSAQGKRNNIENLSSDGDLLMESFGVAGFDISEININKSTYIPELFLSMEELDSKKYEIMDTLDISGEIVYMNIDDIYKGYDNDYLEDPLDMELETILEQRVEEDGYNEIILFVPGESGNVTVVKLLSFEVDGGYETYFLVDIVENKRYKEIVVICNEMDSVMEKYGTKIETTINLTGICPGRLEKADMTEKQNRVFNFLNAKKIEVLEDGLFTSVTAYSPLISSYIKYGDSKVNLQVAMRYSEYEDRTYLWISNPLITIGY